MFGIDDETYTKITYRYKYIKFPF